MLPRIQNNIWHMNKHWWWGLVLLLLMLRLGKTDPKGINRPTTYNVNMRNTLISAKDARVGITYFIDKYFEEPEYHLSLQERQEIARNLWVVPTKPVDSGVDDHIFLTWNSKDKIHLIKVNEESDSAVYFIYERRSKRVQPIASYNLHPSNSRYLRDWIDKHPQVKNQLWRQ
ncbi:hypothetical protein IAD21_02847 [Abditibacteriota bacterium]|nr:hypothetical protein IAD21_02847 [Abditibacteriota bacterium]